MFAGHRDVGRCLGRFVVDGKNSAEGDIGNILSIVLTFPGTVVVDDLDHGIFVICGNVDDGVIRQLQSYFSQSLGKGQASVKKGIECGNDQLLILQGYFPNDHSCNIGTSFARNGQGSWLNTGILPIFSVDPLLLHSFPE